MLQNDYRQPGYNSYVDRALVDDYLQDRDIETTLTDGNLLQGVDVVNSYALRFKGTRNISIPVQSIMQWPRDGVVVGLQYETNPQVLPNTIIPDHVKFAQIHAALEIADGNDPLATIDARAIQRERADVVEIVYDTLHGSRGKALFDYQRIEALLRPVLKTIQFRTSR